MVLNRTCRTCEFGSGGVCSDTNKNKYSEKTVQDNIGCDAWGASLVYYTEITKNAPWYIKEPYNRQQITYDQFLDFLQKDEKGIGIEVNIYDAIEKVYEIRLWELAGVLDVSIGVIGYAKSQGTIAKRKKKFSSRLHIPESFFDNFLSTQLEALAKCKEQFFEFYGNEVIENFKQNGTNAMDAKIEREIAADKIRNEKY